MTAADVAADRAELRSMTKRKPLVPTEPLTPLDRARRDVRNLERIIAKYGNEASVTPEQLQVARNRVKQQEALEAEGKTPAPRRLAPEANPLTWIDPVQVGRGSRVRIVAYDARLPLPGWLQSAIAEKAA